MSDPQSRTAQTICRSFVAGLPIAGAAFTVMTSDVLRDTVCASDETIAAITRLQYSLGEGPALTVFTRRRPVLVPDLNAPAAVARWPVFTQAAADLAGAMFVFPMQLGAITLGVCDTYRAEPGPLDRAEVPLVLRAVDLATVSLLAVISGTEADGADGPWLDGHGTSRAVVHQATGMVTVQLGVPMAEAFGRLRGHAFTEGRDIEQVAVDIVRGGLRLEADPA